MFFRTARRGVHALALALISTLAFASAATAAYVSVAVYSTNQGGGFITGDVNFTSKTRIAYSLKLDDGCDVNNGGDGLTPRFFFAIYNMNLHVGYSAIRGQDARGCTATPGIVFTDTQNWPQNIKRTQVVIELSYNGQPAMYANASQTVGNPYT